LVPRVRAATALSPHLVWKTHGGFRTLGQGGFGTVVPPSAVGGQGNLDYGRMNSHGSWRHRWQGFDCQSHLKHKQSRLRLLSLDSLDATFFKTEYPRVAALHFKICLKVVPST
jgi:hypothetical protein